MRKGSFQRNPAIPLRVVTIVVFLLIQSHTVIQPLHAWTNGSLRKTTTTTTTTNRLMVVQHHHHHHHLQVYTSRQKSLLQLNEAISGSFFNPVPESNENNNINSKSDNNDTTTNASNINNNINNNNSSDDDDDMKLPQQQPSKAVLPSTINGIPSEQVRLDLGMTLQQQQQAAAQRQNDPITRKPYVGIGPASLNDVTKPEYDDQGYTLYVDERTGTKARVFEALVTYPCKFTLKIVGAHDETFVQDVLQIVATTCQVVTTETTNTNTNHMIEHSIKYNGKWASITVQAPVQSAQMLYQLYENVDQDPRVKFKF